MDITEFHNTYMATAPVNKGAVAMCKRLNRNCYRTSIQAVR